MKALITMLALILGLVPAALVVASPGHRSPVSTVITTQEVTITGTQETHEVTQETEEVTIVAKAPAARRAHGGPKGRTSWACGNWHGLASSTGMVKECEWR